MGEMADLIMEGQMCSQCGIMFLQAAGFPVVCSECKKDGSELPQSPWEEL